jgi:hypothetical protein
MASLVQNESERKEAAAAARAEQEAAAYGDLQGYGRRHARHSQRAYFMEGGGNEMGVPAPPPPPPPPPQQPTAEDRLKNAAMKDILSVVREMDMMGDRGVRLLPKLGMVFQFYINRGLTLEALIKMRGEAEDEIDLQKKIVDKVLGAGQCQSAPQMSARQVAKVDEGMRRVAGLVMDEINRQEGGQTEEAVRRYNKTVSNPLFEKRVRAAVLNRQRQVDVAIEPRLQDQQEERQSDGMPASSIMDFTQMFGNLV